MTCGAVSIAAAFPSFDITPRSARPILDAPSRTMDVDATMPNPLQAPLLAFALLGSAHVHVAAAAQGATDPRTTRTGEDVGIDHAPGPRGNVGGGEESWIAHAQAQDAEAAAARAGAGHGFP
jgi:hypothetical protein